MKMLIMINDDDNDDDDDDDKHLTGYCLIWLDCKSITISSNTCHK